MRKRIIAVVVMIFVVSVHAHAITIVDTGTNYGGLNWGLFGGISTGGQAYQWIAGKFTIDQNYTITDITGYLKGSPGHARTATIAIYTDSGKPGIELYSSPFLVGLQDGWYGVNDASWNLEAGSYWAAFEVRGGQSYGGVYPGSAMYPLESYAVTNQNWGWHDFTGGNTALRIDAVGAVVPEPATMVLFGAGLMGLGFLLKKKK